MNFNELLNIAKEKYEYAFFVGLLYSWQEFNKNNIIGIIRYKTNGSKINKLFSKDEKRNLDNNLDIKLKSLLKRLDIPREQLIKLNKKYAEYHINFGFSQELNHESKEDRILILGIIEKHIIDYNDQQKKNFISGVMNGRASVDSALNFFTIDLEPKHYPDLSLRKYNTITNIIGFASNFNPRITQPESSSKNDQYRIALDLFSSTYGVFVPFKIHYIDRTSKYSIQDNDFLAYSDLPFVETREFKGLEKNLKKQNIAININSIIDMKENKEQYGEIKKQALKRLININEIDNDDDYKTNILIKRIAKYNSNYTCAMDHKHQTFTSKSDDNPYVEAHHLIPFHRRNDFNVNIDILENLVTLCPNCHRKIHLSIREERIPMIENLYLIHKDKLKEQGICITQDNLIKMYK